MNKEKLNEFLTFGTGYRFPYSLKEAFNPGRYWGMIKKFIQRGLRGWSDEDTWSFDYYVCKIISEGLKHLAKHNHGHPHQFIINELNCKMDENYNISEEGSDRCAESWRTKLLYWSSLFYRYYTWDDHEIEEFRKIGEDYFDELGKDLFDKNKEKPFAYEEQHQQVRKQLNEEYENLIKEMKDAFDHISNWWD